MAEPTEVKHVRRRIVDRLIAGGLNESEALMLADTLIAAVLAEALARPTKKEWEQIQLAADQVELADARVITLALAAYRRLRGAK